MELWEGEGMKGSGGDWRCGRQDKRNVLVVMGPWACRTQVKMK